MKRDQLLTHQQLEEAPEKKAGPPILLHFITFLKWQNAGKGEKTSGWQGLGRSVGGRETRVPVVTDVLSRPYRSQRLGVLLCCRFQGLTAVGGWVQCAQEPYVIPYNCMRVCNYLTVKSVIQKINVASKKANANSSHNIVLFSYPRLNIYKLACMWAHTTHRLMFRCKMYVENAVGRHVTNCHQTWSQGMGLWMICLCIFPLIVKNQDVLVL